MSLEVLILAHPDSDDGSGRAIEIRSLARPSGDEDPLEDSRQFASGDRDAALDHVRRLLERHSDLLPLKNHRECRRCGETRSAAGEPRVPFLCSTCASSGTSRKASFRRRDGDGVDVLFLGTGDAFGSGGRRPAAIFVKARGAGQGVLLDAGPGCLPALKAEGLAGRDVGALLLSHFHGDHFGGAAFLELDRSRSGCPKPLPALTPPGGADRLRELRRALYPDFRPKHEIEVLELLPGETAPLPAETGGGSATSLPADHQPRAWACGWRLETGGRTLVYSGDTAWRPEIIEESRDADLLIHECTAKNPIPGHTGHSDLVAAASAIEARRVLLVHSGPDALVIDEPAFERAHDGLRVVI